jgi:class 3 adenylate cyclase
MSGGAAATGATARRDLQEGFLVPQAGTAATGAAGDRARRGGTSIRLLVWGLHLAVPLLGLWLLVARPVLDVVWRHPPSHFWMVLAVAGVNVVLGARISEAARVREDARLFLVSLAFLASAGFLFLHALATPGVLLNHPNAGFVVATPVGLFLASVFAALSSLPFTRAASVALMRRQALLRGGLALLLIGWAAVSLADVAPLSSAAGLDEAEGWFQILAVLAIALYAIAAVRYWALHRRRPSVMLLSVITAFALLAESMIASTIGRDWALSWWEWHLLMTFAFGFVAYSAHVQYQREGSSTGLFDGIAMEQTVRRIREEYGAALDALVDALEQQEKSGADDDPRMTELLLAGVARTFGLSEGQRRVLGRASEALAGDRRQVRRLDALVAVGQQARVLADEPQLLRDVVDRFGAALGRDELRVGLVASGELRFPDDLRSGDGWDRSGEDAARSLLARKAAATEPVELAPWHLVLPLTVQGHLAGVLEVRRPAVPLAQRGRGDDAVRHVAFAERDRSLLRSLASQLSIALENTRLYRQIDELFHQYMSPDVATALLADPAQAELGGALVEVTALFADLRGFTTFSEQATPAEIMAMLNRYHAATTPCVLGNGGTIVQFVGDAILALFNAPARQPDHAMRAARCALAMQDAAARIANPEIAAGKVDWPLFRIGINTGPALVGNIGSDRLRNFNAMGDAVNVAARLESTAQPGEVVIGAATYEAIRDVAEVRPLGDIELKGKREPVTAYVLTGLRDQAAPEGAPRADPWAAPGREPDRDGGDRGD